MNTTTVDAKQAVDDIRSGMDDAELMKKYGISAKGLESLFSKLCVAGILSQTEFRNRTEQPEATVDIDLSRFRPHGGEPKKIGAVQPESKRVVAISVDTAFLDVFNHAVSQDGLEPMVWSKEVLGADDLVHLNPDLVVMDLGYSAVNHVDVLNTINTFDDCVPVILVAESSQQAEALGGIGEGAYELVVKPVQEALLENAVTRGLEYADLARFRRDHLKLVEEAVHEKTMEVVKTKDFLKGILNSSTLVSVVLTDLDQNVLFWNTGAENIFGYKADEIVGTKITRLYPPDSLTTETVDQFRRMVKRRTGTVQGKMKQISKDGRELTVSLAISPMLDQFGELQGILGVGLDVTEEVRQHKEIVRLLDQVQKTHEVSIFTLAKLAESRDEETGYHLTRIQKYCRLLCEGLAQIPRYRDIVTPQFTEDLYQSSVLHDIGKVAIPDAILLSTEKFGPAERKIMEQHPVVGGKALEEAANKLGQGSFLTVGMEVAYYHHEHWDGAGYPFGLKGEEIPLSARIVALADVYDALTVKRRYKRAFSHEEARRMIVEARGTQFDPELVDVFVKLDSEFWDVRSTFTLA